MTSPSVFIAGPASWNRLVVLDRLPEPVPHMQFAEDSWETVGGTSAGKALSLAALGRDALLYALSADDQDGRRVRSALSDAGVSAFWGTSAQTERHLNLMTRAGERVSLYLSSPAASDGAQDERIRQAMADADVLVLDLAAEPLRLLPMAAETGKPIWVDVHDYDGEAEFHRPFLAVADAVFCNADKLADPVAFLRSRVAGGASLAVCTLG
ncbi:MAG TPA: carbohydrate kinase family protein, partial [Microbacterium sp.]|nr:carbohydrate kinase family protein [Microbacterium sp.]